MGRVLEFTSFDQVASVSELAKVGIVSDINHIAWLGTGVALVAGYAGTGQAVDGPNNLHWVDTSGSVWGQNKSGGARIRWRAKALGTATPVAILNTNQTNFEFGVNSSNLFYVSGVPVAGNPGTVTSSEALSDTDWHVTEVWFAVDNTQGAWRVFHDGEQIDELTNTDQDTQFTGSAVRGATFNSSNLVVDEVVILADSGIFDESDFLETLLETAKIARANPNGPGFYSAATNLTSTGPALWNEVDEAVNDGNTSRIQMTGNQARVSFAMENLSADGLRVARVLGFRTQIANTNIGAGYRLQEFVRAGGTDYAGGTGGTSFQWTHRAEIWETELVSTSAWTSLSAAAAIMAINGYEVGGLQVAGSDLSVISQVSAEVLYIENTFRDFVVGGRGMLGGTPSKAGMEAGYACPGRV